MAWDKICYHVEESGLGIKDVGRFNAALLAKWKWRLGKEEGGVWKDIIESRHSSWQEMNVSMLG